MTPEEMPYDGRPGISRGSFRPAFLEGTALRLNGNGLTSTLQSSGTPAADRAR